MKDVFAKATEFLTAFDHVRKNGFFESIQYDVGMKMAEGGVHLCSIVATGCVPDEAKYAAEGCGVLIDPAAIVESCKELAKKNKVKQVHVTVRTENWPLWNTAGEEIIGRKGARTDMVMTIQFES